MCPAWRDRRTAAVARSWPSAALSPAPGCTASPPALGRLPATLRTAATDRVAEADAHRRPTRRTTRTGICCCGRRRGSRSRP